MDSMAQIAREVNLDGKIERGLRAVARTLERQTAGRIMAVARMGKGGQKLPGDWEREIEAVLATVHEVRCWRCR